MSRPTKLLLGSVFLLSANLAVAQTNLGELLDAGARKLTGDEFKAELVQRLIVAQLPTGLTINIVYAPSGAISGDGLVPNVYSDTLAGQGVGPMVISGEWTIDNSGRVCTSMTFDRASRQAFSRCEFWFKYNEQYFLSVSDSDRQARVLRRTLKQ